MKKEVILSHTQLARLETIYDSLQREYERVAEALVFSCRDCPDNCCDSYFLHHTYVEWAYLWIGLRQLPEKQLERLLVRARRYLEECHSAMQRGERPQIMCPLNEDGLCTVYQHRLLVCRTHGVPAKMTRPDGQSMLFPGCFRCQEIVAEKNTREASVQMDRTALLQQLAALENEIFDHKRHLMPKVRLTLAEMLVKGPPSVPCPHCERDTTTFKEGGPIPLDRPAEDEG